MIRLALRLIDATDWIEARRSNATVTALTLQDRLGGLASVELTTVVISVLMLTTLIVGCIKTTSTSNRWSEEYISIAWRRRVQSTSGLVAAVALVVEDGQRCLVARVIVKSFEVCSK